MRHLRRAQRTVEKDLHNVALPAILAGLAVALLLGFFPQGASSSAGYHDAVVADSPVGYWRLSESSGTTIVDELGAGHSGSYTGSVTLGQTGPITTDGADTAAYFNGGWGSIPYYADLNPSGDKLSLEFWWKGAAPSGAQFAVLKGYTSHSDPYYQYGVGAGPSGTVRVVVDTSGSFSPWDTGVTWPGDGNWHQIVVTYDGSLASDNLKLYIDGAEQAQTNRTGNVRGYSSPLGLMDILNLGSGYQTTGRLDEVSIYNSALSASRVSAHFTAATLAAPANTTQPSLSGTAIEGQTVSTDDGSWSGSPTSYAYQWRRCDSAGANCSDISGATSSSYTLVSGDVGSRIRAVVTATNAAGSAAASSAPTAIVLSSSTTASYKQATLADNPVGYWRLSESSGTTIVDELGAGHSGSYTGSVTLGQTGPITTDGSDTAAYFNGGWGSIPYYSDLNPSGNKLSLEFWWKGAAPSGAQFAVLKGYTSHSDPYYQYGVGAGPSGTVRVVVDTSGTFAPWDTGVSWPGDGNWHQIVVTYDGSLASNNLKLYIDGVQSSQTNKTGNVRGYSSALGLMDILNLGAGYNATGRLDEVSIYNSALSSSRVAAHFASAFAAPANTALPTITGSAVEGQTLTSDSGSWSGSPTSYAYQWRRCDSAGASCSDISGATSASYTLVAADVGSKIRGAVTATNASGSATASSAATAAVSPASAPSNTAPPVLSGTTTVEWTLSSTTGGWTESPTSFSHQWQRCEPTGNGCADIAGATDGTYVLSADDAGSTIRDRVTATNSVGSSSTLSAASAVIAALVTVPQPDVSLNSQPDLAYNGPYISAVRWTQTDDGGYELQYKRRSTGVWETSLVYDCVSFDTPDWPWNTCANDSQSYDGVGGAYSYHHEIWLDFGPESSAAGSLTRVDGPCGEHRPGGDPVIDCFVHGWYEGDDAGPTEDDQSPPVTGPPTDTPATPQPISPAGPVAADSYTSETWDASAVGTDVPLNVVTSTAPATAAVTGVVLDDTTNQPVQGATVQLDAGSGSTVTTTDAQGTYAFINMPAGAYTFSVSANGYGSYSVTNDSYSENMTYEANVDLGAEPKTFDGAASQTLPAHSDSYMAADNPGQYYSWIHVPPTISVQIYKDLDSSGAHIPGSSYTIQTFPFDYYVLHVIGPEVGIEHLNEVGTKAFMSLVQNFGWYHKTLGYPDVTNDTGTQRFERKPVKVDTRWYGWIKAVLPTRVVYGGKLKETSYGNGTAPPNGPLCDDPREPELGGRASQWGIKAQSEFSSCLQTDWRNIVLWYYPFGTAVVKSASPPPPKTNPAPDANSTTHSITFHFASINRGAPVGWAYILEQLCPSWAGCFPKGWHFLRRINGQVPVSGDRLSYTLSGVAATGCWRYRVRAVNPRGESAYSKINGGTAVCA